MASLLTFKPDAKQQQQAESTAKSFLIDEKHVDELDFRYAAQVVSLTVRRSCFEFSELLAFSSLMFLDISAVGLHSLQQLPALSGLRTLIAVDNELTSFVGLQQFSALSDLKTCRNYLESLRGLFSPSLRSLNIFANPICDIPSIERVIKTVLPQIEYINNVSTTQMMGLDNVLDCFCLVKGITRPYLLYWAVDICEGCRYNLKRYGLEFDSISLFCCSAREISQELEIDSKMSYSVPSRTAQGYVIAVCTLGGNILHYITPYIKSQGPYLSGLKIVGNTCLGGYLCLYYETNCSSMSYTWIRCFDGKQAEVSFSDTYQLREADIGCVIRADVRLQNGVVVTCMTGRITAVELQGYQDLLSNYTNKDLVYMFDVSQCENRFYIRGMRLLWSEFEEGKWVARRSGCQYTCKGDVVKLSISAQVEFDGKLYTQDVKELLWELQPAREFDRRPGTYIDGTIREGSTLHVQSTSYLDCADIGWYVSANLMDVLRKVDYGLLYLEYEMKCNSIIKRDASGFVAVFIPKYQNTSGGPYEQVRFRHFSTGAQVELSAAHVFYYVAAFSGNYFIISDHPVLPAEPRFRSLELLLLTADYICIHFEYSGFSSAFYHRYKIFVNNYPVHEQNEPVVSISSLLQSYFSLLDRDYSISQADKLFLLQHIYVYVVATPIRLDGLEGEAVTSSQVEILRNAPEAAENDEIPQQLVVLYQRISEARKNIAALSHQPFYDKDTLLDTVTVIDIEQLMNDASDNAILNKLNRNYVQQLADEQEIFVYDNDTTKQTLFKRVCSGDGLVTAITGSLMVGQTLELHLDSLKLDLDSVFFICAIRKPLQKELLWVQQYSSMLEAIAGKLVIPQGQLTVLSSTHTYQFQQIDANCLILVFARASRLGNADIMLLQNRVYSYAGELVRFISVSRIAPVFMQYLSVQAGQGLVEFYGSNGPTAPRYDSQNWKILSQQKSVMVRTKYVKAQIYISVDYSLHKFMVLFPASEGYQDVFEGEVVEEAMEPEEDSAGEAVEEQETRGSHAADSYEENGSSTTDQSSVSSISSYKSSSG